MINLREKIQKSNIAKSIRHIHNLICYVCGTNLLPILQV